MAATPTPGQSRFGETPSAGGGATRWDQKPGMMTPMGAGGFMQTPVQGGYNPMMTPTPGGAGAMGQSLPYWQKDLYDRNKPLTDEELDQLIPSSGYEVSTVFISLKFLESCISRCTSF